jgi:hypothetical protein
MQAILKFLTYPLLRPSLNVAAVCMCLVCGSFFLLPAVPPQYRPLVPHVASVLVFWISLRVLLNLGRPPEALWGSIVFALLLLSLLVGFAGVIFAIGSLLSTQ